MASIRATWRRYLRGSTASKPVRPHESDGSTSFLAVWLSRRSLVRPWAEIACPGADQYAALVLLDSVRNPADRAADNEQPECAVARKAQPDRCCGEGEIDIGVTPDQAQPGCGSPLQPARVLRAPPVRSGEDGDRARVAFGIEGLAEPREPLAARQPAGHHRDRIVALQELVQQAFCSRGLSAMKATRQCTRAPPRPRRRGSRRSRRRSARQRSTG